MSSHVGLHPDPSTTMIRIFCVLLGSSCLLLELLCANAGANQTLILECGSAIHSPAILVNAVGGL